MARLATMTVWNVQLGLAVHVKAPNGKYIVIDLGTGSDENESPLSKLKNKNVTYMVITHPHLDHIDDILHFDDNPPKILHRVKAISNKEVMAGARDCDREKFVKYCNINDRYNTPVEPDDEDNTKYASNYGGLEIQTFSSSGFDHSNFNNFSIITVFIFSGIKVVVCGDNEAESLRVLMQHKDFKSAVGDADVLVAPHHGRESAYLYDFVSCVNPRLTIVSDTHKTEASAVNKYTKMSRGWSVENSEGEMSKRYCLTTRNDGNIQVMFGESDDDRYYGALSVRTF